MSDNQDLPEGEEENQGALGGGDDGGANPLTLSDEELMELPLPDLDDEPADPEPKKETDSDDDTEDGSEDDDADDQSADDDADSDAAEDPEEGPEDEDTADDGEGEPADEDNKPDEEPSSKKKRTKKDVESDKDEPDYKAMFNQVIAPFKANNREMKVDNVDDVRQLMQMGANYNKKMAGLKPHLKIIRKLENHGLLEESKLNFLIDLDKKDPGAITKLIKDSGIDPLNVDTDAKSDYKPNSYNVSDSEALLGEVLDDIKGTETYQDTINVVTNKWDESSKRVILESPEVIRVINDHMASGVYDEITAVMDQQRMLGRLTGVSDIEAYKQVGNAMHEAGQFKAQREAAAAAATVPVKKVSAEEKARTNKRKRAAGGSRSAPGKKSAAEFDPLKMSDEEIEKMDPSKFT